MLRSSGIQPLALPPRSPNLNAFAERWVRSIKQECLSKVILFGEASLRRALSEFIDHHHSERNHQGKGNLLLFPSPIFPQHFGTFVVKDDNAFWTRGYPDELGLRLSAALQKRYHKLAQGEMFIIR